MTLQQYSDDAVRHLREMVKLVEQQQGVLARHAFCINEDHEQWSLLWAKLAAAKRFLQFGTMANKENNGTES